MNCEDTETIPYEQGDLIPGGRKWDVPAKEGVWIRKRKKVEIGGGNYYGETHSIRAVIPGKHRARSATREILALRTFCCHMFKYLYQSLRDRNT